MVPYRCETWSLTLREEHRLRVFENRVLKTIFEPKRDEVTGGWRKQHNEELSKLYSLPSIIKIIKSWKLRWAGHVARMGKRRNAGILVFPAHVFLSSDNIILLENSFCVVLWIFSRILWLSCICCLRNPSLTVHRSRKVADSIPDKVIGFSISRNPSSRTMALGSTNLSEMGTRNLPGRKDRPARKVDNLTAICEAIF
jgi:hypothetical protein